MLSPSCRLVQIWSRAAPHRLVFRAFCTATPTPQPSSYSPTPRADSHDDHALRQVFDSHDFWHDFSQSSRASPRCGLLRNVFLKEPKGFLDYAQHTRSKCQRIVDDVLSATSTEEYRSIPKELDRLSDSLCRVLDVADCVRAIHPDVRFQDAATQAYAYLFEYMNILNTTPGLNEQLKKADSYARKSNSWNEEEKTVAQILLKDFSQSAIDLPTDKRRRFVDLSSLTKQLGGEFVDGMEPKMSQLEFEASQLWGMSPLILGKLGSKRRGRVSMPSVGEIPFAALGSVENEGIRMSIYKAGKQSSRRQIYRLEGLMRARAEIAGLSGYDSYAHMSLSDKLAKTPEAVDSFLTSLSNVNKPKVLNELEVMKGLKSGGGRQCHVKPWDILYYLQRQRHSSASKIRKPDFIAAYFSVGTVIQGLSRLFKRLYGISFVPRQSSVGETWNNDVRRLDVLHETEGHVAVLYCDLFARAGKTSNPTHFTLRCSRHISLREVAEANDSPEHANDGMAVHSSGADGSVFQIPVIALICDFTNSSSSKSPALLTFQDVKTLFHEMGHATHSILGRTSLQIVSGTRCPTDFAELPSVLMEYFAADASVLALFARHWESDAPLPYQLVEDYLRMHERGQSFQMETQILFSLLDQAYHSSLPRTMAGGFDSTKVFFDVYDQYSSVREPRDTSAQGLFGHLVEYGGTYYSYLFDRAIAGKLWKEVFRQGKNGGGVDREQGERYKDEVLKWGGARSGWACIAGVLGDEKLEHGGKDAMEEVGRWGVYGPS